MSTRPPIDPVAATEIASRLGLGPKAIQRWRERHSDFPAPRGTIGGRPAWEWRDQILPWIIATNRTKHLPPTEGHLRIHRSSTGAPTASPAWVRPDRSRGEDEGVIPGGELPTLTPGWAAELLVAADRAASRRDRRRRAQMRNRSLSGSMSAEYEQEVLSQQDNLKPKWSASEDADGSIDEWLGGQLLCTWRHEEVPTIGMVWAKCQPGHAETDGEWRRDRPVG